MIYLASLILTLPLIFFFWKIWKFLLFSNNGRTYIAPDYPKNVAPIEPVQSHEIYSKLMSADKSEVCSGSHDVIRTREKDVLNELSSNLDNIIYSTNKKIRRGTNLQVNPLDHAIEKLALYLRADSCLCSTYTCKGYSQYDPEREAANQHVAITNKELHESGWGHIWNCQCNVCGAKYIVEYREYHYPWWLWSKASTT